MLRVAIIAATKREKQWTTTVRTGRESAGAPPVEASLDPSSSVCGDLTAGF